MHSCLTPKLCWLILKTERKTLSRRHKGTKWIRKQLTLWLFEKLGVFYEKKASWNVLLLLCTMMMEGFMVYADVISSVVLCYRKRLITSP